MKYKHTYTQWCGCIESGGCAVLGTVVCDALMRHCLSDEFVLQHEYVLQCQHTFIRKKLNALMHAYMVVCVSAG